MVSGNSWRSLILTLQSRWKSYSNLRGRDRGGEEESRDVLLRLSDQLPLAATPRRRMRTA